VDRGPSGDVLLAIGESLSARVTPTVLAVALKHLLSICGVYARLLEPARSRSPASIPGRVSQAKP